MGVTPQDTLDDWDRQQREEHAQKAKTTIAKLPCCGSGVELEGGKDQYVTCPNPQCPKAIELGRPCRHFISWGLSPKINTELEL